MVCCGSRRKENRKTNKELTINILVIILIVLVVLAVLGFFGRGRRG